MQDRKKYIDSKRYLFLTGNAMDLFGKYIEHDNEKIMPKFTIKGSQLNKPLFEFMLKCERKIISKQHIKRILCTTINY